MIFYLILGFKVNFYKSYMYGINVNEIELKERVENLRC